MYSLVSGRARVYKYQVSWLSHGVLYRQNLLDKDQADQLVSRLSSERVTVVNESVCRPCVDERIALIYNCTDKDQLKELRSWTKLVEQQDDLSKETLVYGRWVKTQVSVDSADFSNFEMLLKYSNPYSDVMKVEDGGVLYLRGLKVYQTSDPSKMLRWGSFSDETENFINSIHARPGSPSVIEDYDYNGVNTVRVPDDDQDVYLEILSEEIIPAGTGDITVEFEYFIDSVADNNPGSQTFNPNESIEVTEFDTSSYDWVHGLEFSSDADLVRAIEEGPDSYSPPVDEITALQLAMVELYEGRLQ